MRIIYHKEAVSTNTLALELARKGARAGTVVWAGCQTGGRGQHDRSFASPPGGLYFSLILTPDIAMECLPLLTLAAGVGCALALEEVCQLSVWLKWPNDLYCGGKKLGGILSEAVPGQQAGLPVVVIGVGINVNSSVKAFPPRLTDRLTSVYAEKGRRYAVQPLLEKCCSSLMAQADLLIRNPDKLLALWDRRDYCKGRRLGWENGKDFVLGTGQGILSDGRYGLVTDDGALRPVLAGRLRLLPEERNENQA